MAYGVDSYERSAVLVRRIGGVEVSVDSSGVDFIIRGMISCAIGFSDCDPESFAHDVLLSCRGSYGFCDVRSIVLGSDRGRYWRNFASRVVLNSISRRLDIYRYYMNVLLNSRGEV